MILSLALLSAPRLFAQNYEKEGQKPAEAAAVQADAGKLAAEAAKTVVDIQKEVTYAEILEKPDDPDLNYAYAKTQIRKGDLKGAAGTLERMLMVNPALHNIRLLYAVVLYRLDNLAEAQGEFETVRKAQVPANVQAEADSYLKAIKKRKQLTHASGGLSAGVEYDTNRNASPTAEERLFMDTPLLLPASSRKKDDASLLFTGNAELRRAVGPQNKHDVFGSFTYYRADQARVKAVNLQAYSYKLGGVYKAARTEITPAFTYDRVLLDQETFLVNTGGSLRLDRKLNKVNDYWLEVKYTYQDNLSIPAVTSNPERRGGLYGFAAGAGRVLNPAMKLNAELNCSAKLAEKDYNAYNSFNFGLRHSWLLGKGMFLLSSAYIGRDIYRQADTVISATKRRDTTFRGGLVGGIPLANIHRRLAKLKDLTLTLNLEHFRASSNILNYTYVNNKAALLVSYRWELGL